jgi:hypothetical protein
MTKESKMVYSNDRTVQFISVFILVLSSVSCVTESVETTPTMRFSEAAVISVQDPAIVVKSGSTFSWLPDAVRFYEDDRLQDTPMKSLIEDEIVKNLKAKNMFFVESANGAKYTIAYTAALESSLDDNAIIRRFGLLPGNAQVPKDDANAEKGTLILYVFDNRTDEVIWRSAAQVSVQFDTPAEQRKARVENVLAEMFKTFPADSKAATGQKNSAQ